MKATLMMLLASLTACGAGPAKRPASARTARVQVPTRSIPRALIAVSRVPVEIGTVRRLIVGRWEGKTYDYDSEDGFSGSEGARPRQMLQLTVAGRFVLIVASCESVGRYEIEQHGGPGTAGMQLRLFRERDCRGGTPYDYASHVHRLDSEILVLIDGATAAVSAFRRADP